MRKVLALAALLVVVGIPARAQSPQPKTSIWQKLHLARRPHIASLLLAHSVTLSLTWLPAGDAPLGFYVRRSQTSGGPYTLIGKLGATWFTYVDKNVVPGSTYYYTATAFNAAGETVPSNELTVIIPVVKPGNAPVISGVVQ